MNELDRRLRSLPARSLGDVIEELAELNARELRGENTSAPTATLHLRSGRDVTGVIVRIARERAFASIVVRTGARSRHDAGSDATYVPFDAVEALTVHEASRLADERGPLARGAATSLDPPPTRLAARRKLAAHRQSAIAAIGNELAWEAPIDTTAEGEPLRALVDFSAAVATALESAARDDMGRSAIATRVACVVLETSTSMNVRLDRDRLICASPLGGRANAQSTASELRSAIEAIF